MEQASVSVKQAPPNFRAITQGAVNKTTQPPKKLSDSEVILARADSLKVHPTAQRQLIPTHLKMLTQSLDLDAIGVLHGVRYAIDGGKPEVWIIDGQHRLMALMENGLGEWIVEVKIHLSATNDIRASKLFLSLNKRASVHPYDKFKNALTSQDQVAIGVNDLAVRRGMAISKSAGDNRLTCISSLEKIYRMDGGRILGWTLNIVTGAWGTKKAAIEGKVIDGVSKVVAKYYMAFDRDAFIAKLAKYPGGPSALIGDAKGRLQFQQISLAESVAAVLIETYNAGRRTGKLERL